MRAAIQRPSLAPPSPPSLGPPGAAASLACSSLSSCWSSTLAWYARRLCCQRVCTITSPAFSPDSAAATALFERPAARAGQLVGKGQLPHRWRLARRGGLLGGKSAQQARPHVFLTSCACLPPSPPFKRPSDALLWDSAAPASAWPAALITEAQLERLLASKPCDDAQMAASCGRNEAAGLPKSAPAHGSGSDRRADRSWNNPLQLTSPPRTPHASTPELPPTPFRAPHRTLT